MCLGEQFSALRQKYPYLYLHKQDGEYFIKGTICLEKDDIKDRYEVEIIIPQGYPQNLPTVKETASKIPQDFHHNPDGSLCLEIPLIVYEVFRHDETLLNFVDNLVVPYLYSYSFYSRYKKMPYGEHAHGAEGVLADYKKRFQVSEDRMVLSLLQILAEDKYRGHHICPCGSGLKLRNCHGQILLAMKKVRSNFMKDYLEILVWMKTNMNFNIIPYISKKVKKVVENLKNKPNEKWSY